MRIFGLEHRNLIAIGLVGVLIIFVYGTTSALNIVMEDDPNECNSTYFSVTDVCMEPTGDNTLQIDINEAQTNINGFKIKVFGENGVEPLVVFKTIAQGESGFIKPYYNKEIYGKISRIELQPLLNINQQIYYCSLRHGIVYEGDISTC